MNKKIVIIGASGHGKVVANIAKLNGYKKIVFLDDDRKKKECYGYKVIGALLKIDELIEDEYDFIVAIGDNETRKKIFKSLMNKNVNIPTLIHPSAVIDETVIFGKGTVVMANVVINAESKIGEACIINTAATVDHDCVIKDYVHISPGANIAGNVFINSNNWIGIGAVVINGVSIINDCVIGANSLVKVTLAKSGIYVGIPARRIK